jgi:hypothetical protein
MSWPPMRPVEKIVVFFKNRVPESVKATMHFLLHGFRI